MSAQIPETKTLKDLLKPTGFDCPEELLDKTFAEATSGGGAVLENNKEITITENGTTIVTPSAGKDGMKKVTATVNVETPKADKYFLWSYSASPTSWTNVANTWASMCSNAGKTPLNGGAGTAFPVFLYIKGKDATSDFTLNEQITIYSSQDASNSATVTVNHIDLNYLVVTNPKTGATGNIYLSRTKEASITTFLTTFARFDGVTKLPTFEAINVTENAVVLPPNTADGIGYAFVNVPPVVTEPSKIITETFTPELNTPHHFSTSAGPGGSYGLSDSGAFNKLIKASDISGGTITTARITWGPGASQGYYVDFSLAVSGSGYPQTLIITPTAIGSAWGTRKASVCFIL